jgi:hypothetical protein
MDQALDDPILRVGRDRELRVALDDGLQLGLLEIDGIVVDLDGIRNLGRAREQRERAMVALAHLVGRDIVPGGTF